MDPELIALLLRLRGDMPAFGAPPAAARDMARVAPGAGADRRTTRPIPRDPNVASVGPRDPLPANPVGLINRLMQTRAVAENPIVGAAQGVGLVPEQVGLFDLALATPVGRASRGSLKLARKAAGRYELGAAEIARLPDAFGGGWQVTLGDDVAGPFRNLKHASKHARDVQQGGRGVTAAAGRVAEEAVEEGTRLFRLPDNRGVLRALRTPNGRWAVFEEGKTFVQRTDEGTFLIRSGRGVERAERRIPIDLDDLSDVPGIQQFDSLEDARRAIQEMVG